MSSLGTCRMDGSCQCLISLLCLMLAYACPCHTHTLQQTLPITAHRHNITMSLDYMSVASLAKQVHTFLGCRFPHSATHCPLTLAQRWSDLSAQQETYARLIQPLFVETGWDFGGTRR